VKKLASLFVALFSLVWLTGAGWLPLAQSSGGCSDTDATTWAAAVVTAGGTVSGAQQTRVCTLIQAYKSASVWTIMDRVWLLAAENTQQANIDLVNRSAWTLISTPTFSANVGYTADGGSGINTNFTPSGGGNFLQNSAHASVYAKVGNSNTNRALIGVNSNGFTQLETSTIGPTIAMEMNGNTFNTGTDTGTNGVGQYTLTRTSSSLIIVYKNEVTTPVGTSASASTGEPAIAINIFSIAGFGHNSDTVTIAGVTIGGALTSTQMAAAQNAMNVYQTAISNNVY